MLGLLLALHAIFAADESAHQRAPAAWTLDANALRSTGIAVAATHATALARIKAGAGASAALQGTRHRGAVGMRICRGANRMLTAYGLVSAAEAPTIVEAIREAVHPESRVGFAALSSPPSDYLPPGCPLPADHVWIAAKLD